MWEIPITNKIKDAYKNYFNISIIGQDKSWAPHIACKICVNNLYQWMKGKPIPRWFVSPMVWLEPTDHATDCYFCLTKIQGFNIKNIPHKVSRYRHGSQANT